VSPLLQSLLQKLRRKMKLNKEELIIGAIIPLMFFYCYGWWVILICPITSLFWAMAGAEGFDKFWRRVLVPASICLLLSIIMHRWWVLFGILPAWGSLSIGYGYPSTQPPDEGSALGRFWWKVCKQNQFWTDFFTRGTIYLLFFTSIAVFLIGAK
jgi:hypothetical protein